MRRSREGLVLSLILLMGIRNGRRYSLDFSLWLSYLDVLS